MNADRTIETITTGHLRLVVASLFADSSVPEPTLEADRVMCAAMEISRAQLHAHPERIVGGERASRVIELAIRRATGEPLAYLTGTSIFCGRDFYVDSSVLIPRIETEYLVEAAISELNDISSPLVADWCTGSGCVAVTIACRSRGARVFAVDVSAPAIATARRNARAHGVDDRMTFIECGDPRDADVIEPRSLDLVTANPPYIPSEDIASLDVDVRDFEPRLALDGGRDGLDVARAILEHVPRYMKIGAPLMIETGGADQIERLAEHARRKCELEFAGTLPDHRDIHRFAIFRAL